MRLICVQLRDFRAFPGELKLDLKDGCNLLVHGENGSGKSSVALALREFFTLERPFPRPIEPHTNIFADPVTSQPLVHLTFRNAAVDENIEWQKARPHPLEVDSGSGSPSVTTKEQREMLMTVSRSSGFFDYRALLRASLSSQSDKLPEQLFLLFVENLLSGFQVKVFGSERSLGELWADLKKTTPMSRRAGQMSSANSVAKRFDNAFKPFLNQLTDKANEYLNHFPNNGMKIGFDYPGSSFAKTTKLLTGKAVNPSIEFNGKKVDGHHEFLNEARLTALALSVFLGAVKLADSDPNNGDPLRLLVLDDVLIGLDLNNRLPLLELLRIEFSHHQIILLTHDPVWFDIAKEHTTGWGTWGYARLFEEVTGPGEPQYPRLRSNADDLVVADGYLKAGDLRAAAVYIRAAFENRLKTICEDNGIEVGYKVDSKLVTADKMWTAVLRRQVKRMKKHGEFLDPTLIPRISAIRSAVLNRLSHSGTSSLTKTELATALQTVIDFRKTQIPFKP